MGFFFANAVVNPMSRIVGKVYQIPAFAGHLNAFCSAERGCVLKRDGAPRRYRYRFSDPLLEPFAVMTGLSRGLISAEVLEQLVQTS